MMSSDDAVERQADLGRAVVVQRVQVEHTIGPNKLASKQVIAGLAVWYRSRRRGPTQPQTLSQHALDQRPMKGVADAVEECKLMEWDKDGEEAEQQLWW